MNLRSNIKKVLKESTFFRRRVDTRLVEKEFYENLNRLTDSVIYKLEQGKSVDLDAFTRIVMHNLMDDFHDELSDGGLNNFPYDEVYDFLLNLFHDKIKDRYDLIVRSNINESVPSQVKRRQQNFDDIFVAKRNRLISCDYRTPEYLFNGLLELTLEDLYFSSFVDSVTYEEWEESVKYIEKYLTKKYYNETSKMWASKCKGKLYESFTGDTPTDITKQFINKPVKLIGDVNTNTIIQNVKIGNNGSVNIKFQNGMSVNSSLPMLRRVNFGVAIPLEFKVRKKTIVLESNQNIDKKINLAIKIIENEYSDVVKDIEVTEYFDTPTIVVKVYSDKTSANVTTRFTEDMIDDVSELTNGKVKLDYWFTGNRESEILLRVFNLRDDNKLNESEDKITSTLDQLVNMLFDGFDNIDYDWANYMCGMGECCDPYAIGFTLPEKDYDDYIFKLVDGNKYDDDGDYPKEFRDELPEVCYEQPNLKNPDFDTIVFYGVFAEEIEEYLGSEDNWKEGLLELINRKFGCDAKRIVII
jgi:hypothetical protein